MKALVFIIIVLLLCAGCRSSRQESSVSLTDVQLDEWITFRLTHFHSGNKSVSLQRRDSTTVTIIEYNAPDSTGRQSKKSQTVISSESDTHARQQETDASTTHVADSAHLRNKSIYSENNISEKTPLPWYSGFEPYIVLVLVFALFLLLKRLRFIKF